jgi:predicted signal transduction protein with EAL and GGDEF domain
LLFLAIKAGLLGLIAVLVGLVGGLIAALHALLACIAIYVDGFYAAFTVAFYLALGFVKCVLCLCGFNPK